MESILYFPIPGIPWSLVLLIVGAGVAGALLEGKPAKDKGNE